MDFFTRELAGNPIWSWALALIVLIGGTLLLRYARNQLARRFGDFSVKTSNVVDDLVVSLIERTKTLFLFVFALAATTAVLSLPGGWEQALRAAAVVALLLQAGIWGTELLAFGIKQMMAKRREDHDEEPDEQADIATFTLLRMLGRLIVWSAVALLCLDNLGVDITALVAGLGVGGIAVALAVQNVLGDLFASFSILLDKPFVVGDFIVLGDYMGTVQRIGIKTTRVLSLGGEQLVFSNNDLLQSRIRNYKRMQERRVLFSIGVTYQTPPDKAEAIPAMVRDVIAELDDTRFDRAHFKAFGDSSLLYEVVYYVLSADYNRYMDVQQQINFALYRRFEDEGIDFAYPTRTLHLTAANGPIPTRVELPQRAEVQAHN